MVIHFDRVTHGFGTRLIIDDVSLVWEGPGLVLLCGESGSGKTTFLRLLQGDTPLAGTIYIEGLAIARLTDEEKLYMRRNIISVVHQQPHLLRDTTVEAMIQQVMKLKSVSTFPHFWFQTFLNDCRKDQMIRTLSRGQVQRLAVLLATLGPSRLLLLDEPLDGLDQLNRQKMIALMESLARTYRCIVATHHVEEFPPDTPQLQFPLAHVKLTTPSPTLQSLPQKAKRVDAFSWSFLWSYHHKQHALTPRWHLPLPTLMLVLMTLIFSTTNLMGGFLQRWTHTMLGGDYQWIEPLQASSTTLHAPTKDDIDELKKTMSDAHIEKDFDVAFFSQYFPSTIGYINHQGYKAFIPHFSMDVWNEYAFIEDAPFGYQNIKLREEEMIIGIEESQLIMLSKAWGIYPTYYQLDQFVQRHRPLVYFDFEYEPWGYSSQIAFEIIHIVASEKLTLYHSMPSYHEHIYANVLRFPLTPFDQPAAPWFIPYTYRIRIIDHPVFLHQFAHHPFFKHWDIQRKDDHRYRLFKHLRSHSIQHPPNEALWKSTMHHSEAGYQFLPQQWMQGFALPVIWSKEGQFEDSLLHPYLDLPLEEWLSVHPPPQFARSHVYLGAQASVTLAAYSSTPAWDHVSISSALAYQLNLVLGDHMIGYVFYRQEVVPIPLKINEIVEQASWQLYLAPLRWEMLLLQHVKLGSWSIQPIAYAYYGEESISIPAWTQSVPFQSIQASFHSLQKIGYGVLIVLFFLLLLPSFIVFVQTIQISLLEERQALQTMAMIGFSVVDLTIFLDSKLVYQGVKIIVYFAIGFLPLEGALQQIWADSLGFNVPYAFPFLSLFFTSGVLFFFYLGIKTYLKHDVLTQIKKLW